MCPNLVFIFIVFLELSSAWIVDPGPKVVATKGEIWPKPQKEDKSTDFYVLTDFDILVPDECEILHEASQRYTELINSLAKIAEQYDEEDKEDRTFNKKYRGRLSSLNVFVSEECDKTHYPSLGMDESYKLVISKKSKDPAILKAKSVWGVLRGLESFSQLLYIYDDDKNIYINATTIEDHPRFPHRGLLMDTGRHYFHLNIIYQQLDAMAYNKMNVFHWHMIDDESFPYESKKYPDLSKQGAYNEKYVYTQEDVKNVVEYARLRGIRVIPEFDTPGHTRSWGEAMPELLSPCYKNGKITGQYGPMDPSKESVYTFLDKFYNELQGLFPDSYMHIGGDEVNFDCWHNNDEIHEFMKQLAIGNNYKALQSYFMDRLLNITESKSIKPILWEEAYLSGTKLPQDSIIEFWYRDSDLKDAVKDGHKVILSSRWYLDRLMKNTTDFYNCDPQDFVSHGKGVKLILGGEVCLWDEEVNSSNVMSRTWPRASAAAEKLWSKYNADSYNTAKYRLEEHACRMNRRGISAEPPNGPGYCLF